MVEVIPERLRKTWEIWNIRGVILISLLLQIILTFGAPMRKSTENRLVILLIWSSYFLAEWAASFALRLITSSQSSKHGEISDLYAFWASFLLLHHGGPDTITAYEENELWLRHFLALISQVGFTLYVLLQTLPENNLWLPTSLIFFVGIIKYAERIRSLFLGSWGTFRLSMLTEPDPGPEYAKLMEAFSSKKVARLPTTMSQTVDAVIKESKSAFYSSQRPTDQKEVLDEFEVVKYGYHFFKILKGLIADLISYEDLIESRAFCLSRTPENTLEVLEVELNFIYEILYTKVFVVHTLIGYFRLLTFPSVLVSLGIFFFLDCKHGLDKFDIRVTYTLLLGALSLEAIALFNLIFSDWTTAFIDKRITNPRVRAIFKKYLKIRRSRWTKCEDDSGNKFSKRATSVSFRRWSESVAGFNLIIYCLKDIPKKSNEENYQCCLGISKTTTHLLHPIRKYCRKEVVIDRLGAKDFLDELKYASKNSFTKELWNFIFEELLEKSKEADAPENIKTRSSARGAYVLGELKVTDYETVYKTLKKDYIENVTYDESLLLWHIATELCYHGSEVDHQKKAEHGSEVDHQTKAEHGSEHEVESITIKKTLLWIKRRLCYGGEDSDTETVAQTVDHQTKAQPDELGHHGSELIDHETKKTVDYHGSQVDHDKKDSDPGISKKVDHRRLSKLISDYMLYLLVMKSTMMSAVAGIGQIRYRDTCAEAKRFFLNKGLRGPNMEKKACDKLLAVNTDVKPFHVKGDRSKSVLFDACILAKELQKLEEEKKWEVITKCGWRCCHTRQIIADQMLMLSK